jgi:hypothetical protein
VGLVFLIGGGALVGLGLVRFWDTWEIGQREPQTVSAAELRKAKGPEAVPGTWVSYTFEEGKKTDLIATRTGLVHGGDVQAQYLLVRVKDKWLLASVAPGFQTDRLVGHLQALDPAMAEEVAGRLREEDPKGPGLLPYEFNAVDGCASEQRTRYVQVGMFALFGLLGLVLGLRLVRGGPRPAPKETAPATVPSSFALSSRGS